jgi:hypothetical protein
MESQRNEVWRDYVQSICWYHIGISFCVSVLTRILLCVLHLPSVWASISYPSTLSTQPISWMFTLMPSSHFCSTSDSSRARTSRAVSIVRLQNLGTVVLSSRRITLIGESLLRSSIPFGQLQSRLTRSMLNITPDTWRCGVVLILSSQSLLSSHSSTLQSFFLYRAITSPFDHSIIR